MGFFTRRAKPEPMNDTDWRRVDVIIQESPDRVFAENYRRAKTAIGYIQTADWQGTPLPPATRMQLESSGLMAKLMEEGAVKELDAGKPSIELRSTAQEVYLAEHPEFRNRKAHFRT